MKSEVSRNSPVRTVEDLERAVRAIADVFQTDTIVVVGSQAILVGWPDASELLRTSKEIDVYPANYSDWESENSPDRTYDVIDSNLGSDTTFHITHGFFIDGVDVRAATLPQGWQQRAVYREVFTPTSTLRAVAPCVEDLIVSKLARLIEKDSDFIEECHRNNPLDVDTIKHLVSSTFKEQALIDRAHRFLDYLPKLDRIPEPDFNIEIPELPTGTHLAFYSSDRKSVSVRRYDEEKELYTVLDNPLGPAVVTRDKEVFALDGQILSKDEWSKHPRVTENQDNSSRFQR